MFRIHVFRGRNKEGSHTLEDGTFLVGRGSDVDIVLAHPAISRHQLNLLVGNGQLKAEAVGEQGLVVNGYDVPRVQRLLGGDHVELGPYTLAIEVDGFGGDLGVETTEIPAFTGDEAATARLSHDELEGMRDRARAQLGAHLVLLSGGEFVEVPLEGTRRTVGFSNSCDVQLEGAVLLGKVAALLVREGSGWAIESQSSFVPVKVQGQKIKRHKLREGDVVELRGQKFRYRAAIE